MSSPRVIALARTLVAIASLAIASCTSPAVEAQKRADARGSPSHEPAPPRYVDREDVRAFIGEMHERHGFDTRDVERWLGSVRFQPRVVELMTRPVVDPPKWFEYAPQFLAQARIDAGLAFWSRHLGALQRAESTTGVPAEVIVAIIGVETYYGRYTGNHRVLDALATLAFDYPRRAAFFRGELEEFLVLAREQGFSPLAPRGSYAGAMGLPQFMPGSYRRFAVDFDGNGRTDLFGSAEDAIGSVANYLARHDWQRGQPALLPARIALEHENGLHRHLDGGLSERRSPELWASDGVTPVAWPGVLGREPLGLLTLEESPGESSYWIAAHNFYVILRYNRSRLYAAAVWQLAESLRAARLRS